jgi:vancomycin resistance protein YoaR
MLRWVLAFIAVALSFASVWSGRELARRSLEEELPAPGDVAEGLRVNGVPVEGELAEFVQARADELLDREVHARLGDRDVGSATLRELGATVDVDRVVADAERVAHVGSLTERVREARAARAGEIDLRFLVDLPWDPETAFAQRVLEQKDATDSRPRSARRLARGASHTVVPHEPGAVMDVLPLLEGMLLAATADYEPEDPREARTEPFTVVPSATTEAVTRADTREVLGSFDTRFGGAPGRNKNIERAASLLDGAVIMPGEVLSFNDVVGPRTVTNGFFAAPEIYKGEMREGIGGGACQVASTVYAAAFYGGLAIEERRNHSRPSAYIRQGLDATVSYPVLDLKIKNPFEYPVVLSAKSDGGVMRVELLGARREVAVTLATQTKAILKFNRKIERARLPEGEFRVKQRGKRGLSLLRRKTTQDLASGSVKVEESVDVYPPTQEIVMAAPGVKEADLPPLDPGT